MTELNTNNNTANAVESENQAPAMTAEKALAGMVSARNPATEKAAAVYQLGDDLKSGYYEGEGENKYLSPELVDYAEEIGRELAAGGVTPRIFGKMNRILKSAKKLPLAGQLGAIKKLMPLVVEQEQKKKALRLLREVIERNRDAVKDGADYEALIDHFADIGIYLSANQAEPTEEQAAPTGTPIE